MPFDWKALLIPLLRSLLTQVIALVDRLIADPGVETKNHEPDLAILRCHLCAANKIATNGLRPACDTPPKVRKKKKAPATP
jgi:hypothetical protein